VTFSVVTYSTTSLTEWRHLSTCVRQSLADGVHLVIRLKNSIVCRFCDVTFVTHLCVPLGVNVSECLPTLTNNRPAVLDFSGIMEPSECCYKCTSQHKTRLGVQRFLPTSVIGQNTGVVTLWNSTLEVACSNLRWANKYPISNLLWDFMFSRRQRNALSTFGLRHRVLFDGY
jgi:hypothetical protein